MISGEFDLHGSLFGLGLHHYLNFAGDDLLKNGLDRHLFLYDLLHDPPDRDFLLDDPFDRHFPLNDLLDRHNLRFTTGGQSGEPGCAGDARAACAFAKSLTSSSASPSSSVEAWRCPAPPLAPHQGPLERIELGVAPPLKTRISLSQTIRGQTFETRAAASGMSAAGRTA